MSFLQFFVVFYKKKSDFLQVVCKCKKYSESTVGNGTHGKTVIFTVDIFAVYELEGIINGNSYVILKNKLENSV